MKKISEIFTAIIAAIGAIFAALFFMRKSAGQSAAQNETIADEHEEMADVAGLVAIEERQQEENELDAARESAKSTDIMAKDEKEKHSPDDGWTWTDIKSK